jgi:hypothetical protein
MKKYKLDEGLESLNRVKLLMSYKNDMTLTENEEILKNNYLNEAIPKSGGRKKTSAPTSTGKVTPKPASGGIKTNVLNYIKKAPGIYKIGAAVAGLAAAAYAYGKQINVYPDTRDNLDNWYKLGDMSIKAGIKVTHDQSQIDNIARKYYSAVKDWGGLAEDEDEMVDAINECNNFVDFKLLVDRYKAITQRSLIDDFVEYTEREDFDALRLKSEVEKANELIAEAEKAAAAAAQKETEKNRESEMLKKFKNFIRSNWATQEDKTPTPDFDRIFNSLTFDFDEDTSLYLVTWNGTDYGYKYDSQDDTFKQQKF